MHDEIVPAYKEKGKKKEMTQKAFNIIDLSGVQRGNCTVLADQAIVKVPTVASQFSLF